ncbi:threonine--tRNA ligase [Buchnera aphidicola (Ceratoglyphina bambusae)]|uniref:threonine--tRNA ligase n=1 Tax=Buchnera aphidicola TaxID=9 RepID=UPI0031B86A67
MSVVIFPDGSRKIYTEKFLTKNIFKNINIKNEFLIALKVDNKLIDLNDSINRYKKVFLITNKKYKIFLKLIRSTCANLLSHSIKKIWPNSKMAGFKITTNGFYCDFDVPENFNNKHLILIYNKMIELCKRKYVITKRSFSVDRLIKFFFSRKEIYQVEILKEIKKKNEFINIYFHNNYLIFIPGVQLYNINLCINFSLTKFSGVYWKNDKKNKVLQRIYCISLDSKKTLLNCLKKNVENIEVDHRKIGSKLNLYHIQKESPGMIFWHKNGLIIFKLLKKFIRKHLEKYDYEEVSTPLIMKKIIWEKSGHLGNYADNIFKTFSENKEYCIKPMNCPGHIQIFKKNIKSYKDLPIRLSEFGICHRNEYSGSLHGLMRIRSFTQDDAHIFCSKYQIENEVNNCIDMIFDIYKIFNFNNVKVQFSTRPKKSIGSDSTWEFSENLLSKILNNKNIKFTIKTGEGAFYGPKIEFILKDSLNRFWQCGTIQLDFYIAKRLKVFYINKHNIKKNPIIIHRAILGSIERFIGILIEEYNGYFPLWLAPIQIVILSITEKNINYVNNLFVKLKSNNFRIIYDIKNIPLNAKIRKYSYMKIPYILICGDREEKNSNFTVRYMSGKIVNNVFLKDFVKQTIKKIYSYSFF